ncbi:MAG: hypothetical protein K2L45_10415 [Muribaculaceae bacterium]|nr:hypothetical protein [Muribaculaceae bacterium]
MTELEMMRWILGILIAAGALAVTVMYFFRNDETPAVSAVETGDNRLLLQQALMSSASDSKNPIPSAILESEAYEAIQRNIRDGANQRYSIEIPYPLPSGCVCFRVCGYSPDDGSFIFTPFVVLPEVCRNYIGAVWVSVYVLLDIQGRLQKRSLAYGHNQHSPCYYHYRSSCLLL